MTLHRLTTITVLLLLQYMATAQTEMLIVTRPAILHKSYNSSSATVSHLDIGEKLLWISQTARNNYYHVQQVSTGNKGWVYKNYVQRLVIGDSGTPANEEPHTGVLDSVSVRVVDVDNGLCTIIKLPGNKYVLYDAGGLTTANGSATYEQMLQTLDAGTTIEFMVLSHMDGDHIVAAEQAIRNYNVKKIIWGGYDRKIDGSNATETDAFQRLKKALYDHRATTKSINLHELDSVIYPGGNMIISGVSFKLLCGFGKPLPEWNLTKPDERLNAVSIVMKMEYAGNSVLFTGDALGRRKDNPETTCIATEKFLVDHVGNGLQSTVMFSPHHGAENGSSKPFLDKVKPQYIVIPAGHVNHKHPREITCMRYLNYVPNKHIFRTDRGDDQGELEWDYLRIPGCKDAAGDDDIQIDLRSDHKLNIYYSNPVNVCVNH
jgi:beta-lactamase superfamily II metal-dependent hydrolase